MSDNIITYEKIYEYLRKEKYEPEIQKLPETFFEEIINYLKEKKAIVETQKSQESIFSGESAKTEKQLQNVKKILKELYEKRENKIIQLALFSSRTETPLDTSNLLQEEQEFYQKIVDILTRNRNGILNNLLTANYPRTSQPKDIKAENQEKTKLIKFLTPVPKFLGEDLNVYGPFSEEDIGNIPQRVARLLISKKRAQEIKS